MPLELSTPVQYIKRVGNRVAASLAQRGIVTVEDLLYHLPFRYEDRLHPKPLSTYAPGDMASVVGEVRGTVLLRTRSVPIFEMTIGVRPLDAPNGSTAADTETSLQGLLRPPPGLPVLETIKCLWFNGTYLRERFRPGQTVALYGKLEGSRSGNAAHAPPGSTRFKMIQPTFEILPDANALGEDAEFTVLEMGRIVPVYPSLGGTTPWGSKLGSRWLRRVMWTVFRELTEAGVAGEAHETLPPALRARLGLPSRLQALSALHFPAEGSSLEDLTAACTPAHRRLIFEEFFFLELGLELKRRRLRERTGTAFVADERVRKALKQILPFKPTAAQKRVLGEIVADMRSPQPMRRLLQGDVGSGKTIVAFEAALIAIENGFQAALMAPTEILATQHFLFARKLLADAISPSTGRPYRLTLLTGSLDARSRRDARSRILRGEADLVIGTHALVEDGVDFRNLGLVIVDEQHRFGVQQRFQLMHKPATSPPSTAPLDNQTPGFFDNQAPGSVEYQDLGAPSSPAVSSPVRVGPADPDMLVMTATPIPRTLALTLYGDLDASVLDQLPPGRTPIATRRMPVSRSAEVWDFVRKQVALGRQAYIVYPVIEGNKNDHPELDFSSDEVNLSGSAESPARTSKPKPAKAPAARKSRSAQSSLPVSRADLKAPGGPRKQVPLRSATDALDELTAGPLAGLRLGLLHGRLSADDKEVTMARFKRGEIQVLIATTVIEVGVDVPNATLMVVEHAERFGLAQLHQLRGRVGRGKARSFCVLLTGHEVSAEAEARLDAMVSTQNGFELAEIDLRQRGPGEFFGTRQAGLQHFQVADLTRDRDLLELAKSEAARFARSPDPQLTPAEIEAIWTRLKQQWQRRYGLVEA